jgi:Fe-S-cluster containining protein
MSQYYRLFSDTKQQYGTMVRRNLALIHHSLAAQRERFSCTVCDAHPTDSEPAAEQSSGASDAPHEKAWYQPLPVQCGYRHWQQSALHWLEQDAGREITERLNQIEAYKNTFSCHMCGMCCRLASSEYSYEELTARADAGDEFARQFTSIFLPYASRETARQKYPEVVAAVLAEAGLETEGESKERIHFYHCPYIGQDNRCTLYGTDKRPGICASYPETPLSFVYEKCAWKPWKEETHEATLQAHALLAVCSSLSEQLQQALH